LTGAARKRTLYPARKLGDKGSQLKKHATTVATVLALLVFLGASIWWAIYTWTGAEGGQISGHGWTAIVLTVVFSLVVGFGLMGLLFYSRRQGYDEPPEIDLRGRDDH
jgi:hypothetical protein